ncbi:hypothetical protein TESG_08490 [Trichophyton tonsurans CBS 112818]|uniref:Uncharacterized protein n=1 Tax=Trichophyton tonsurans (strain CBS 112818) TaxID=647933 RepID=F2S174_TRIT1|nr:hypothetical protein TESG_08490 [Trichophyton tonsurans CBS 112818]
MRHLYCNEYGSQSVGVSVPPLLGRRSICRVRGAEVTSRSLVECSERRNKANKRPNMYGVWISMKRLVPTYDEQLGPEGRSWPLSGTMHSRLMHARQSLRMSHKFSHVHATTVLRGGFSPVRRPFAFNPRGDVLRK